MITDEQVERALDTSVCADETGILTYSARALMEWAIDQYTDDPKIRDELPKRVMRAALEAALPQWQPIDTAPKDGSITL